MIVAGAVPVAASSGQDDSTMADPATYSRWFMFLYTLHSPSGVSVYGKELRSLRPVSNASPRGAGACDASVAEPQQL